MNWLALLAGSALVIAALVALARANARDLASLARALGLEVVRDGATTSGPDPVLGTATDTVVLAGTLDGHPATVRARSVRRVGPRRRSLFTVLSVPVPPGTPRLRLEPARTGAIAASIGGDWPGVLTGDDAFDRTFRLNAPDAAAALAVLDADLRARLLALRASRTAALPANALGRFAGDLLTGTFELDGGRLDYAAPGTPGAGVVAHLVAAAPCVTAFARRVRESQDGPHA